MCRAGDHADRQRRAVPRRRWQAARAPVSAVGRPTWVLQPTPPSRGHDRMAAGCLCEPESGFDDTLRLIGSTPKSLRQSSMNALTTVGPGRAPWRKHARRLPDLIHATRLVGGVAQLANVLVGLATQAPASWRRSRSDGPAWANASEWIPDRGDRGDRTTRVQRQRTPRSKNSRGYLRPRGIEASPHRRAEPRTRSLRQSRAFAVLNLLRATG